ncbi:MAG: hypothetical protein ACLP59_31765 [Bryobacteraceae bacterium]
MNTTATVLFVIVCFVGGYAVVAAIMRAFSRPKQTPEERRYREVLGVPARASEFEIQAAYRQFTAQRQYRQTVGPEGEPDARAKEIDEAYEYFKSRYGFR